MPLLESTYEEQGSEIIPEPLVKQKSEVQQMPQLAPLYVPPVTNFDERTILYEHYNRVLDRFIDQFEKTTLKDTCKWKNAFN